MRKIRIVITGVGTAMPALVASVAMDCGGGPTTSDGGSDATTSKDVTSELVFPPSDASDAQPVETGPCPQGECSFTVPVPDAGTFPDLASVCAVASPVVSNDAATVTLSNFDAQAKTADGFIAMKADLLAAIVGVPVIAVSPNVMTAQITTKTSTGFTFTASWSSIPQTMTAMVTFQVACGDAGLDGGVQTVESTTDLALCGVTAPQTWESSGSTCIQCCVVCEMAPTPILSDNMGDDLPLSRALRLRVIEVARAGKQVVLFAQNDAGDGAEYDWRVSGGSIERVSDDVIVWTLPEDSEGPPFGQLAVWNDNGAIVENFYWGAA